MKKYLIIFLLLLASNGWCQQGAVMSGCVASGVSGVSAAAVSCTSSNDTELVATPNSPSTTASVQDNWYAYPVGSLSAGTQITGVTAAISDSGGSFGGICELWTDNAGSPNAIVGAGYTCTKSNLQDTYPPATEDFLFASTQTIPTTASYWVVCKKADASALNWGRTTSGTSGFKYSSDGGSTWSTSGAFTTIGGVIGCAP
ncbi:MAG: hypothetical protein WC332_00855 [Clostridia bacterium]|jgi:hypothetical protein